MKKVVNGYRQQAKRSRELAKRALVDDIRKHLLRVAEEYDKLADDAEAKEATRRNED